MSLPLLPVARATGLAESSGVSPQSTGNPLDPGDPTQCDYWRYCAIDGYLCSCCGRCWCNRNEGKRPPYRAQSNNDLDWCLGTASSAYTCSTSVIQGLAIDQ